EFEIKGGKSSGHSTLPPSVHREDPNFHYKNYGQQKLFVSDDMYDRLIEALAHCLKPKRTVMTQRQISKNPTLMEKTVNSMTQTSKLLQCRVLLLEASICWMP
ncbi:MAG: hypothetical protein WA364_16595, partial [Candidatus Nitrosopolaris sp.]